MRRTILLAIGILALISASCGGAPELPPVPDSHGFVRLQEGCYRGSAPSAPPHAVAEVSAWFLSEMRERGWKLQRESDDVSGLLSLMGPPCGWSRKIEGHWQPGDRKTLAGWVSTWTAEGSFDPVADVAVWVLRRDGCIYLSLGLSHQSLP